MMSSNTAKSDNSVSDQVFPESAIQDWLVNYMVRHLRVTPAEVDLDLEFDSFGLDSAVIIEMTVELEEFLGTTLDPTLVYDYHTINRLAKHLGSSQQGDIAWNRELHR